MDAEGLMNDGFHVKIIYEDNHLMAVEKPANMLSQADGTGDADLLTVLKDYIKKKYNKPGNVFLGLVHRLDRPVGGAMVFAKTSKAASRLSEQIRKCDFRKTYLAVVHGVPAPPRGRLEHYLAKDERTNIVRAVAYNAEGKKAVLDYEVIQSKSDLSLVKINLLTGRPHQIRVQFSAGGHPLYGDARYGLGPSRPERQIALWSLRIACKHPTKGEDMVFTSKPPVEAYPWNLFKHRNL